MQHDALALALVLSLALVQDTAAPASLARSADLRLRPERSHPPAASFTLPMRMRGPTPAVEVRVNGEGPFLFAIDTGAQGAARVDRSLVERLGLEVAGAALGGDPTGRAPAEMHVVELASLELGDARFEGVQALSRDYNAHAPGLPRIDGILGYHLFGGLALTLDFPGREVRVEPAPYEPLPGAIACELTSGPDDVPRLSATIGGIALEDVTLDTGKMGGLGLPTELLERLELLGEPTVAGRGRTVTGEFEVLRAQVDGTLELCGWRIAQPWVDSAPVLPRPVLGAALLDDYVLTLDPDAGRAWLLDAATQRALARRERSPRSTTVLARTELTLQLVAGRPWLELRVNGEGPYRFLLDTGAARCVVSPGLADALRLERGPGVRVGTPGGARVATAETTALPELALGDVLFEEVPALVMDLGGMLGRSGAPDGIAGIGLFADVLATIDLARGVLVLEEGALPEPDGERVLAIEWEDGGRGLPGFVLTIGDRELHAHLDTGAPAGIGLPLRLREVLPLDGEPAVVGRARTISGESELWSAPLAATPRLGAVSLADVDACFFEQLAAVNLGGRALERRRRHLRPGPRPRALRAGGALSRAFLSVPGAGSRSRWRTPGTTPRARGTDMSKLHVAAVAAASPLLFWPLVATGSEPSRGRAAAEAPTAGAHSGAVGFVTLEDVGSFVDVGHTGTERGIDGAPFDTVQEVVNGAPPVSTGVVLHVDAGTCSEGPITVDDAMILHAEGGVAVID